MDQELKQRIMGAVVVTALAAIFIPMLFDDPVEDRSQQVSSLAIPAAPNADSSGQKAPAGADEVFKEENLEAADAGDDEEPLQPVQGPDIDDEGGLDKMPVTKLKRNPVKNAKPIVGNLEQPIEEKELAIVEDIDQATADKIDAEVEKLRPKAGVKPDMPKNQAPAKPVIDTKPVAIKKAPVDVAVSDNVKPKSIAKENVAPAALDTAKNPVAAAKPAKSKRWYIQVGSFGKKENAVSLSESLRKDGFPVIMDTVQGEKGTIYRLKIGPEMDGKRAAEMKSRLDRHNVNSMLMAE